MVAGGGEEQHRAVEGGRGVRRGELDAGRPDGEDGRETRLLQVAERPAGPAAEADDAVQVPYAVRRLGIEAERLQDGADPLAGAGRAGVLSTGWIGVEQGEQRDPLTVGPEAGGDRVRDEAAEGPAEQVVRPGGLDLADPRGVVDGHLLDAARRRRARGEGARLQTVDGAAGQ